MKIQISDQALKILKNVVDQAIEEEINFPSHEDPWMDHMIEIKNILEEVE